MKNKKNIQTCYDTIRNIACHSSQLKTEANMDRGFRCNQVKD